MIELNNIDKTEPYIKFEELFNKAKEINQPSIDAICISSYCSDKKEIDSRYVNLKYIDKNEWIFFSNYTSKKASQFKTHNQISVSIYWNKIETQVRMKAIIRKTNQSFSDYHYHGRDTRKNALAHSSNQSKKIESYEHVHNKYNQYLKDKSLLKIRPEYWGGYTFIPYQFEFWTGHNRRLNYRELFEFDKGNWNRSVLEP